MAFHRDDTTYPWDDDRDMDPRFDPVDLMTPPDPPVPVERCPSCAYNAMEGTTFDARFCPSEGDRCGGCEVDPSIRRCPECGHEWSATNGPF